MIDNKVIYSVSEITRDIQNILESRHKFVRICGEISNLTTPYSGHSYFVLKDDTAQIRGVLFKQQKKFIDLALENGQQVLCFGRITVYQPRGEYQLVVDSVQLEGEGQLQLAYEKLKKILHARGYFSADTKKELPKYPEKIAIITSPTGAAIQDFLKIYAIRESKIHILILPVKVQGALAADEISGAIETANSISDLDIIVLCRGGGSLEDLWAFNEEKVARAIYQSEVPIVTGIGHEIDFTISDFCGDFRCPTPTGVAEKIIPDTKILTSTIIFHKDTLCRTMHRHLTVLEKNLEHKNRQLLNFCNLFQNESFRLKMSKTYLANAMVTMIREKTDRLSHLLGKLHTHAPVHQIRLQSSRLDVLQRQLKLRMRRLLEKKASTLAHKTALLDSVSPLATLGRGYSITRSFSAKKDAFQIITDASQTQLGDTLNILLQRGELECEVKKKIEEP